ncbi:MAG TPA: hypothetical protein ENN68_01265 [Methanomicrobia archaeon]|nr:hypothetical protein [Methanomicrobia archaeon]
MVQFEKDEMDVMRKSGQVIGNVADDYISDLYQLDRTRNVEEFIKQLKNIGLRAISISKKEKEPVYTEPLANLVDLINKYKDNYDEIKDIVLVYASVYLGIIKYKAYNKSRNVSNTGGS